MGTIKFIIYLYLAIFSFSCISSPSEYKRTEDNDLAIRLSKIKEELEASSINFLNIKNKKAIVQLFFNKEPNKLSFLSFKGSYVAMSLHSIINSNLNIDSLQIQVINIYNNDSVFVDYSILDFKKLTWIENKITGIMKDFDLSQIESLFLQFDPKIDTVYKNKIVSFLMNYRSGISELKTVDIVAVFFKTGLSFVMVELIDINCDSTIFEFVFDNETHLLIDVGINNLSNIK